MLARMIHLLSIAAADPAPVTGGEVAARMAGLRRALRLLEPSGGGPSCDEDEFAFAQFESEARRRCFDGRSERVIASAAAGLEAVVSVRGSGSEPTPAAVSQVADAIRAGLADLSTLLRR